MGGGSNRKSAFRRARSARGYAPISTKRFAKPAARRSEMPERYRNTVVGSYPRPVQVADTMKKPTLSSAETDDMIRWAAKNQADLGLDVITDGEAYRENMYYFYQKRVDGVTFEN